MRSPITAFILVILLSACSAQMTPSPEPLSTLLPTSIPTPAATLTPFRPEPTKIPSPTPTVRTTLAPDGWQSVPVVPEGLSRTAREIYARGIALGNNPNAFSKIGDCETSAEWFLANFDQGPDRYSLGSYTDLQAVIDHYQGSFKRRSLAAERSFTTASVLSQLWANRELCLQGETPLECEYRIHKPSVALIMLGTNEASGNHAVFEGNLRKILDLTIERGILPVLATKADNLEGDHAINAIIARLAEEYEIPLWNFWLAVQPLPDHGLQEDGAHLTYGGNHFEDTFLMQKAWPWRNLTALQVLDMIRRNIMNE